MKSYLLKYKIIIIVLLLVIAFCMMFVGVRYTDKNYYGLCQGKISDDWMFFGDAANIIKYDEFQMNNININVDWNDFDITLVYMKNIYVPIYVLLLIPFVMALYSIFRKKKFNSLWLLIGVLPFLTDIILNAYTYINGKDVLGYIKFACPSIGSIMCLVICLSAMVLNIMFNYWEKQGVSLNSKTDTTN